MQILFTRLCIILQITVIFLISPFTTTAQPQPTDTLAYVVNNLDGNANLMLFDSFSQKSRLLLKNIDPDHFKFSLDGHLAYSLRQAGIAEISILNTQKPASSIQITHDSNNNYPLVWSPDSRYLAFASYINEKSHSAKLYILDTQNIDSLPVEITPSSDADIYLVSWSRDSHNLAFVFGQVGNASLYVWNGQTTVNITPQMTNISVNFYELDWSIDGRLAFTLQGKSDRTEIYIWDGKTTSDLSQNPLRDDMGPAWSPDNKLAYLSQQDKNYGIFVWDGKSIKDGVPDRNTYLKVGFGLAYYESFPYWLQNGLLKFIGQSPQDDHVQIFVWDGKRATNISQNPTMHNGNATWSNDERWAFSTFFSPKQLIYIRDQNNRNVVTLEGSQPTWSPNGELAYCYNSSWTLFVWNGKTVVNVADGREIWAQWLGGSQLRCTSG